VGDDEFERTLGALANEVGDFLVRIRRDMRARLGGKVERSPGRDAAAPMVAQRLFEVHQAFADAAIGIPVIACPCCNDPQFIARLETIPAAELSEEDVESVVASISLTLGSASDVPYFVPRWCSDGLGSPLYDITMAFSRIAEAGYASWSDRRRSAVERFLIAQLRYVLSGAPARLLSHTLNHVSSLYESFAYLGHTDSFFPYTTARCKRRLMHTLATWSRT